jgi:hypothetical protein
MFLSCPLSSICIVLETDLQNKHCITNLSHRVHFLANPMHTKGLSQLNSINDVSGKKKNLQTNLL